MAHTLIELGRACARGKVWRKGYTRSGYTRKDGTRVERAHVPGGCVVDRGAPGKTPPAKRWAKFPERGEFLPGWGKAAPEGTRRAAVARDARRVGCRETWRKLDQLSKVTTDRPTKAKALADREWLRRQKWCPWKTPPKK